ncbi:CoA transferase, partial [Pantoea sp. SIMBA_133]
GVAPTNNYPTKSGKWIVIGANADNIFKRLTKVMDRVELSRDDKFSSHNARGANQEELDNIIGEWTVQYELDELTEMLDQAGVPAGGIYTAEDIAN